MKISKREKYLLVILLFLGLGALYYTQVYTPQKEQLDTIRAEHSEKTTRYESLKASLENEGNIELELKKLKEDILPLAEKYFGKVDQEEFIVLLNEFADKSGLAFKRLNFSNEENLGFELTALGPKVAEGQPADNTAAQPADAPPEATPATAPNPDPNASATPAAIDNIKLMRVKAEFEGNYTQMKKLLNVMDTNDENVISNQFRMEKVEWTELKDKPKTKDENLKGEIYFDFYSIEDLSKYKPEVASVLEAPFIGKSGKATPISSYPWSWVTTSSVTNVPSPNTGMNGGFAEDNAPNGATDYTPVSPQYLPLSTNKILVFDGTQGLDLKGEEGASSNIMLEGNDIAKGMLWEYSFENANIPRTTILLDRKNIVFKNKPKSLNLNIFVPQASGHRLGATLQAADGQRYDVVFSDNLNFTGWKELRFDAFEDMAYPVKLKEIYVMKDRDEATNASSIVLDYLSVTYQIIK